MFSNLPQQINNAERSVKELQNKDGAEWDPNKCIEAENHLTLLLNEQDQYWQTKAKRFEILEGDRNTSFFHQKANQRRSRNKISQLKDANGTLHYKQNDFESIILHFYANLFHTDGVTNVEEIL